MGRIGADRCPTNKLFAENVAFHETLGHAHEHGEAFKGRFIVHMRKEIDAFDPAAFLRTNGLLPAGASIRIQRLAGGYQNEVFRALGEGVDWVVKRFRPQSDLTLFPNDAAAEARALQMLGAAGLAPCFVHFAERTDAGPVLVYEFYAGAIWLGGDVASIAAMLARLHALPADGFRLAPTAPLTILDEGGRFVAVLTDPVRKQDLAALRPAPVAMPSAARLSLIHTDTGPGNIVSGKEGLRLIDWQCPALGDAAEDIAAFLSPAFQILYDCQPLDAVRREDFLRAYGDAAVVDRFLTLEPFFNWRMAAYCAMRVEQYRTPRPDASAAYQRAYDALAVLLRRGDAS